MQNTTLRKSLKRKSTRKSTKNYTNKIVHVVYIKQFIIRLYYNLIVILKNHEEYKM